MARTVTIFCRVPMGMRLDHPEHDSVVVFGSSHPDAEGDRGERVGVTRGIHSALWDAWRRVNFLHPALESEIWAEPEDEPGAAEREHATLEDAL
jgi:hypothetical protein